MNILIIGGAGFLGANLVRRCLREPGNNVTVLDSLESRLKASTDNLQEVWDRIRFVLSILSLRLTTTAFLWSIHTPTRGFIGVSCIC